MIGIFDSGSGGLTVLRALRARAPQLDIVYFGDTANMPYGEKSDVELQRLTIDAMRLLRREGADYIVSACNSVSASVIRPMMELFGVADCGVTEMVGPAVRGVLAQTAGRIMVIATPATINSKMYEQEFAARGVNASSLAVPDLAAAIEHDDATNIQKIINDIAGAAAQFQPDIIVLACTHYPLVSETFRAALNVNGLEHAVLFDPADAVAGEVIERCGTRGRGILRIITSAPPPATFERRVWAIQNNPQLTFGLRSGILVSV